MAYKIEKARSIYDAIRELALECEVVTKFTFGGVNCAFCGRIMS